MAHAMRIGTLGKQVAAASQGNFFYLYHYTHGLRRGDARLLDLKSLPNETSRQFDSTKTGAMDY